MKKTIQRNRKSLGYKKDHIEVNYYLIINNLAAIDFLEHSGENGWIIMDGLVVGHEEEHYPMKGEKE